MTDQMHDKDRDQRHNERMARKKEVVDAAIAEAAEERGVFLVNTGNGKGKSSAGFGLVARAIGHGMKVGVVQFIKGRSDTGEEAFYRRQPEVAWHVMGEGFTWETQDRARDVATAEAAWEQARALLGDPAIGLVVL
ncbi:MAG: cob(I)yrinic acid a,c-diamide adenosyltransferase, partial [Ottowia sp.]|nr:cob(I)yrinic acid a,c-diamide adenosyltransferase [Ottowia sp.]